VTLVSVPPALIQGTPTFTLENGLVDGAVVLDNAPVNPLTGIHVYKFAAVLDGVAGGAGGA